MRFNEKIRLLRIQHGLSQAELGRIAGVSDKAVSTWENGGRIPRMGAIEKMASYFSVRKSELLDDDGLTPPPPLSSDAQKLLGLFDELNPEGREKLVDYADDLAQSGKYKKIDPAKLGKEA